MKKFLAALVALTFASCAGEPAYTLPHQDPSLSWDQANLKQHDDGCPSAIFVAPNGSLVQCEMFEGSSSDVTKVKTFATANAAALYVVGKIYERSHYYEYGGVIVKTPKGYAIAPPSTQHHGTDVSFDEDPESYDYPIVATYHVHPCLGFAFSSVFSPQDLAGSRMAHNPGYVLDECTGALHYWAPGDGYMSADDMIKLGVPPQALVKGIQISVGKIVGYISVDGVILN
jgi:hypothetical protein